ncbi:uncharacterized protein CIMG_08744 [Coccidioides immitis RS]|uniref:Uncharacterized protein n=1 Tax=Coccidioides immitis (strain RS) TaxID=246410 RepID=J3K642_COCIM|nr:uncharacterized protein CIMG_08744 [Coccidioides immitis RS]EAS29998.3 hypothetical protein CIMG_08744 [Coccidioides immitis RS]
MASPESGPRRNGTPTAIIIEDTDAEMAEPQSPLRKLRRKRPLANYSFPAYDALFKDLALPDGSASTASQPLKKRKMPSLEMVLETANQGIHRVFEAESATIRELEEKVRYLEEQNTELETKHRAELIVKHEQIHKLEAEVRELERRCFAQDASLLNQGPVDGVVKNSLVI